MKRILITGKNSYIGTSVEQWLMKEPDQYQVDTVDMIDGSWRELDFSDYDVVFHVAGIVHQKEKPEMKDLYFKVNRDLPVEVAKKAKESGVGQFIFMSTMAVYGEDGKLGQEVVIRRDTPVNPKTYYGASKVEAERELIKLDSPEFHIVILRPPMIYGPNCPGNYAKLEKIALKSPIFPSVDNIRSMLNIDQLCKYVKSYINRNDRGIFFPQDDEYVNTSLLVMRIAKSQGKKIYLSKTAGFFVKLIGRRMNIIKKMFGNLVYEQ